MIENMNQHRLSLGSLDIVNARLEHFREMLPEAFVEGRIDFDRLRLALGDSIDTGRERYGLSWAGKAEAIQARNALSVGTLVPCPTESVNFDTAENVFIEGDNLEVLKLLQKSYYGRVKMIYIDPPYNTGNEFIYPDNYREGLEDYLRYSGQVNDEGIRQSTNSEASGRFHSKWLSMMYPRLFLARNLLTDDGLIFVSISDHEVANLRAILNEVFGEENFVVQLVWKGRQFPDSRAVTHVSTDHEYVVVYAKSSQTAFRGVERDESKFSNPDNDPRGPWMSRSILGLATAEQRPNLHYPIIDSSTGNSYSPPASTGWRYAKERMNELIADGRILFPNQPDGRPREKKFRSDLRDEFVSFPSIVDDVFTAHGTAEIRELFGFQAFDFPKPSELIRRLVEQATTANDTILDFFAGSATTGHAVLIQNQRDGGTRKFICVQLPEPVDGSSEVARQGYSSIAAIGKERLRRALKGLQKDNDGRLELDGRRCEAIGFRVFKLMSSNFRIWSGDDAPKDAEALGKQLKLFADHVDRERSQQDILYELTLKAGLPLTAKIDTKTVAGQPVFSIADGLLLICLADPITQECLRGMIALAPQRVVCLDPAFKGNDKLKTNTVLEMQSHGIAFRTV